MEFVRFLALLVLFSIPFWVLGLAVDVTLPANLPMSALMFICPAVVAMILTARASGVTGVGALLRSVVDPAGLRGGIRYLPVVLLVPAATVVSYWVMRLGGQPLPDARLSPVALALAAAVFFVAAAAEEMAWTAYLLRPLQERWGGLVAGVVLGVVWAAWHLVPYLQLHSFRWAAWQCAFTVALRVVIVWLWNRTGGNALSAVLLHDLVNVAYSAFPEGGSHYDPTVVAMITIVAALCAAPSLRARYTRGPDRSDLGDSGSVQDVVPR